MTTQPTASTLPKPVILGPKKNARVLVDEEDDDELSVLTSLSVAAAAAAATTGADRKQLSTVPASEMNKSNSRGADRDSDEQESTAPVEVSPSAPGALFCEICRQENKALRGFDYVGLKQHIRIVHNSRKILVAKDRFVRSCVHCEKCHGFVKKNGRLTHQSECTGKLPEVTVKYPQVIQMLFSTLSSQNDGSSALPQIVVTTAVMADASAAAIPATNMTTASSTVATTSTSTSTATAEIPKAVSCKTPVLHKILRPIPSTTEAQAARSAAQQPQASTQKQTQPQAPQQQQTTPPQAIVRSARPEGETLTSYLAEVKKWVESPSTDRLTPDQIHKAIDSFSSIGKTLVGKAKKRQRENEKLKQEIDKALADLNAKRQCIDLEQADFNRAISQLPDNWQQPKEPIAESK
jgi:hypothetical protein